MIGPGKRAAAVAVVVATAGCYDYVYQPEENATAMLGGQSAAIYQIPPQAPNGDVRLSSTGIAKVPLRNTDEKMPVLHVRMAIANNSNRQWTLDTRDVQVDYRDKGYQRIAFVRGSESGLPFVTVPPLQKRNLDLFFPLPATAHSERKLPEFDVVWRVSTNVGPVQERTPFARLEVVPVAAGPWYYYAFGPYGWAEPWWPGYLGGPIWY